MICTAPALPPSAEILEPGTSGMCCPWNPINSGTHTGSEACENTQQVGTKHTQDTHRTHSASPWLRGQIPPSTLLTLPHSWGTLSRASNLYQPSHISQSLPKPLSCRNMHRVKATLQQHSEVFPSHWHRQELGRLWKVLVSSCGLCMGNRNGADVFSFGSGLDLILQPGSCRSSPDTPR